MTLLSEKFGTLSKTQQKSLLQRAGEKIGINLPQQPVEPLPLEERVKKIKANRAARKSAFGRTISEKGYFP